MGIATWVGSGAIRGSLCDGAGLTSSLAPEVQDAAANTDVCDADGNLSDAVSGCAFMQALKSKLDAMSEFGAAGFGTALDASERRLTISRGQVARGYWVAKDDQLLWHPATMAERLIVVATVDDALMQTLRMVLASLSLKHKSRD